MTRHEFLRLVEEALEADPSTISGDETLEALDWDSLATLTFLALVDDRCELALAPKEIVRCKTVADLVGLMGDKVEA